MEQQDDASSPVPVPLFLSNLTCATNASTLTNANAPPAAAATDQYRSTLAHLVDGVTNTTSDEHMWLAPFNRKRQVLCRLRNGMHMDVENHDLLHSIRGRCSMTMRCTLCMHLLLSSVRGGRSICDCIAVAVAAVIVTCIMTTFSTACLCDTPDMVCATVRSVNSNDNTGCSVTIRLATSKKLASLIIWNYNKQDEHSCACAKEIQISIDSRCIINSMVLRKGIGRAYCSRGHPVEYGQHISFSAKLRSGKCMVPRWVGQNSIKKYDLHDVKLGAKKYEIHAAMITTSSSTSLAACTSRH